MKRSRFSEEQIIAILKGQEAGMATAEVCRRYGISPATFYKWKAKFGGLDVFEARRLQTLGQGNARLKKLLHICREEGLRVRRRGGRKRALGTPRPMVLPGLSRSHELQ